MGSIYSFILGVGCGVFLIRLLDAIGEALGVDKK